jgi:hypothetical protein
MQKTRNLWLIDAHERRRRLLGESTLADNGIDRLRKPRLRELLIEVGVANVDVGFPDPVFRALRPFPFGQAASLNQPDELLSWTI